MRKYGKYIEYILDLITNCKAYSLEVRKVIPLYSLNNTSKDSSSDKDSCIIFQIFMRQSGLAALYLTLSCLN